MLIASIFMTTVLFDGNPYITHNPIKSNINYIIFKYKLKKLLNKYKYYK